MGVCRILESRPPTSPLSTSPQKTQHLFSIWVTVTKSTSMQASTCITQKEQVCWMTFPTTSALSSTTTGPNSHPNTHSSRMLSVSYLGCYLSWLYWETRVSSTYSWAPSE